jgi:hypothetical protein
MKMEAVQYSETLVDFYWTTWQMELLDVKMKNKNLMEYNFVLYFASP